MINDTRRGYIPFTPEIGTNQKGSRKEWSMDHRQLNKDLLLLGNERLPSVGKNVKRIARSA